MSMRNVGRSYFFHLKIVDGTFNYFQIERIENDKGRTPWDLKNMIKLMFLAAVEKNLSSIKISESAKGDIFLSTFL